MDPTNTESESHWTQRGNDRIRIHDIIMTLSCVTMVNVKPWMIVVNIAWCIHANALAETAEGQHISHFTILIRQQHVLPLPQLTCSLHSTVHMFTAQYCSHVHCTVLFTCSLHSTVHSTVHMFTAQYCSHVHCTVLFTCSLHSTVHMFTAQYCSHVHCTVLFTCSLHCTVLFTCSLHSTVHMFTAQYCSHVHCTVLFTCSLHSTVHMFTAQHVLPLPQLTCSLHSTVHGFLHSMCTSLRNATSLKVHINTLTTEVHWLCWLNVP